MPFQRGGAGKRSAVNGLLSHLQHLLKSRWRFGVGRRNWIEKDLVCWRAGQKVEEAGQCLDAFPTAVV